MNQTPSTTRRSAKKASLAATAAAITKNIIGAAIAKPETVQMPQAVVELHVTPDDIIPAGTIITEEIALEAGLDEGDVDGLIEAGHVKLVDVYAVATPQQAEAEAQG